MPLTNLLTPFVIFIIFCITHSLFASKKIKARILRLLPGLSPFYRFFYNVAALVLLFLFFLTLPPDELIYRVTGFLFWLMVFAQLAAATAALLTLKGHGAEFLGLRQISQYIRNKKLPGYLDESKKGKLLQHGFYRYMRHPLYTFSMLVLIASPIMTVNLVFTAVLVGIYFYVGSFFEERSLTQRFGEDYVQYKKEVPRFVPKLSAILK